MKISDKKNEILDCAQSLIQKRGYNGFSYADISSKVGIRKASIHHHFPTKVDLAIAIIERYGEDFDTYLATINGQNDWLKKIELYTEVYKTVLSEDKLCLCGMLASDMDSLPEEVKMKVRNFLSVNADWLADILAANTKLSKIRIINISWQILNQLQGGLMLARILENPSLFKNSCQEMLSQLKNLS
ncbi:MAG: TetR/AcrR family transcriptional regulator [Tatlockia sp.]|nr:TetR/AcrR family transcriptional regulator [Tatlockia sp.]